MTEPKLLTEADVKRLHGKSYSEWPEVLAELRERGLIAPEPVDPAVIEAREMFVGVHERGLNLTLRLSESESGMRGGDVHIAKDGAANKAIRAGDFDEHERLQELLAALRRGMELAPAQQPLTREMVREAMQRFMGDMPDRHFVENVFLDLRSALTGEQA